jgi:hypothetical protein
MLQHDVSWNMASEMQMQQWFGTASMEMPMMPCPQPSMFADTVSQTPLATSVTQQGQAVAVSCHAISHPRPATCSQDDFMATLMATPGVCQAAGSPMSCNADLTPAGARTAAATPGELMATLLGPDYVGQAFGGTLDSEQIAQQLRAAADAQGCYDD